MINKYIIPACEDLEFTFDDVTEIPELTFNASGNLKLADYEYSINIQILTEDPEVVVFDVRDEEKKIGTRGGLPLAQFDEVALSMEANPVAVMISECYEILANPENPQFKEYIFEY